MISTTVMAHPARTGWAEQLATLLGCHITFDRRNDLWDTARRAWLAYDPTCTHHLVIQDDAIICRDLPAAAAHAAAHAGHRPVSFYLGDVRPRLRETSQKLAAARTAGTSWVEMPGPYWAVAVMLPTSDIDAMVRYGDTHPHHTADDAKIEQFYRSRKQDCWYTAPSLVDHRTHGNPTLLSDRRLPDVPRQAQWFIGADRSGLDIDWSRTPHHQPVLADSKRQNGYPMSNGTIYVATASFAATVDGKRVIIRRGLTRVRDGHQLIKDHPDRFTPIDVHYDVEQATQAPGERRKVTRKKATAKADDA